LFLKHYKLAANPFAPQAARPFFLSHTARQALLKLDRVLEGSIHCLHLSGPAGVGKSTLVGRRVRELDDVAVSWIRPGVEDPGALLSGLLGDLGLESVEGSVAELRKIIEVFLRHQLSKRRRSLLVADGLESLSGSVLRELEWLAQLRLRGWPLIQLILVTRNEDLTRNLLPESTEGMRSRHEHQRLTGFMLDETQTYIRACLHGAGCYWEEELIPEEVIVDIQGFTRGVVADINVLCCEALNVLAERVGEGGRQPKLARILLKEIGAKLNLKYDPSAWQLVEEALTPDAVQLTNPEELKLEAARLFVSSGGRTVVEIALNRPRIVLGRDQSCDISLDSSYVSRYQNLFMETADGWLLIDLNSTNGSFVNGRRIREHRLRDGDVIAVGRHQMRFAEVAEKRVRGDAEAAPADTTVSTKSTADTATAPQGLAQTAQRS
jgi:general secretion pathway protein A